ncbi:MAG: ribonuclease Y [Tissierellia bacterium]|nr:ribonuclease Y [Tissierellia bacterium]
MGILTIILPIITVILGFVIGFFTRKSQAEKKIGTAESYAVRIIDDANREAETKKKELLVEAKDEIIKMKSEQELENRERRLEIQKLEDRLALKEDTLDQRTLQMDKKSQKLDQDIRKAKEKEQSIQRLIDEQEQKLQEVAELTQEEARDIILENVRTSTMNEQAAIIREIEQNTKEEAEKTAREIISVSIQRYAADQVAEATVSVVNLPNDEMKGRIIGREGRNIRAFETLTGVDLIIDDTPEAVVLSCFDPIRREKARIALEKLILDGRIHPTRIEEMVNKAEQEVEQTIKEKGEEALDETHVHGLHPELVKLLGKLHYRTSYGQNVLKHTIEVSNIAGMLANEIGANVRVAKRGGLLHDIGKAIDHEVEGPHVQLGVQAAKRYKENKLVLNCIEAHHGDVEPECIEAVLVQAADALSAARPGARRESIENYIQRLQNLEEIANSFDGVSGSYAIQAGREIRIMLNPDQVNDDQMFVIAKDIAKRIEEELEYPGQIKVHVIRENRAFDYAK